MWSRSDEAKETHSIQEVTRQKRDAATTLPDKLLHSSSPPIGNFKENEDVTLN